MNDAAATASTGDFVKLLLSSHARLIGAPLVPRGHADPAAWLYENAPFCVLAHDIADDPCFVYANKTAQRCFEYSWDELIGMPSRLSAEIPHREERERLLEAVASKGFASGYRGLRIAKSGRTFWIEDVTVWNVLDESGVSRGQAATYRKWRDA